MLQDLLKQLLAGKTLVIAAGLVDSPPAPAPASQTQLGPALPPLGKIPADYQPPDVTVRLFPPDYAIYQDISQLPVHALSATWLQSMSAMSFRTAGAMADGSPETRTTMSEAPL